jgi:hypothetical protein
MCFNQAYRLYGMQLTACAANQPERIHARKAKQRLHSYSHGMPEIAKAQARGDEGEGIRHIPTQLNTNARMHH